MSRTIELRYARYTYSGAMRLGASPDAAVAAAVKRTLLTLLGSLADSALRISPARSRRRRGVGEAAKPSPASSRA